FFLGITLFTLLSITGASIVKLLIGNTDINISFFPFGLMAIITGVCQSLFKVHNSLLQTSEKPSVFFWSNLLSFSFIALFTVAGLMLFSDPLIGPVGGRMLAGIASAIWVLGRIFSIYPLRYNFRILRNALDFNKSTC